MKNIKRYLALAGVVLLVGLYVLALVFAFIKSPVANMLFRAAFISTFVIPIFIYANILIYRYLEQRKDRDKDDRDMHPSDH